MSESTQWAVLMPFLLLVVLGVIQGGIWLHGRTVASNAAVVAAEEAALLEHSAADARARGEAVARQGGLVDVTVTVTQSATEASATVAGRMPTFFDVGQTRVSERSTRPRERVTTP